MIYTTLRAIPFKSTWEGGTPFFFNFSVGCGGETIFFYVGIRFVVLRDRAILPEFAPKQ
jgi:hypothetical protein